MLLRSSVDALARFILCSPPIILQFFYLLHPQLLIGDAQAVAVRGLAHGHWACLADGATLHCWCTGATVHATGSATGVATGECMVA